MSTHRLAKRSRVYKRVVLVCSVLVLVCLLTVSSVPTKNAAAQSTPPRLVTRANTTRAIALESVTLSAEPFPLIQMMQFGADSRTRILLFVENLGLLTGEGAEVVSAEAEDGNRIRYPMVVERVDTVTGYSWMRALVIRRNQNRGDAGDVLSGITVHGRASNRVRVGIGHIGG